MKRSQTGVWATVCVTAGLFFSSSHAQNVKPDSSAALMQRKHVRTERQALEQKRLRAESSGQTCDQDVLAAQNRRYGYVDANGDGIHDRLQDRMHDGSCTGTGPGTREGRTRTGHSDMNSGGLSWGAGNGAGSSMHGHCGQGGGGRR